MGPYASPCLAGETLLSSHTPSEGLGRFRCLAICREHRLPNPMTNPFPPPVLSLQWDPFNDPGISQRFDGIAVNSCPRPPQALGERVHGHDRDARRVGG